jgi:hypothetical protein
VNPGTANGLSAGLTQHAFGKINSNYPHSGPSQSQCTGACPGTEVNDRLAFLQMRNLGKEVPHAFLPVTGMKANKPVIEGRKQVVIASPGALPLQLSMSPSGYSPSFPCISALLSNN